MKVKQLLKRRIAKANAFELEFQHATGIGESMRSLIRSYMEEIERIAYASVKWPLSVESAIPEDYEPISPVTYYPTALKLRSIRKTLSFWGLEEARRKGRLRAVRRLYSFFGMFNPEAGYHTPGIKGEGIAGFPKLEIDMRNMLSSDHDNQEPIDLHLN